MCNRTIQIDTQKKIAWLAKTSFEKGSAYSGFSFELDLVDVLVYSWPRLPSMVPFHLLLMFLTASSLFSLMFHLMFVFHHFYHLYTSMQKAATMFHPGFLIFHCFNYENENTLKNDVYLACTLSQQFLYIWVFPKIMVPPNHHILIGCSMK